MLETGFTGLFELFRAFTGFYLVLPSFIMLDNDFTRLHRVLKRFDWVLLGFLGNNTEKKRNSRDCHRTKKESDASASARDTTDEASSQKKQTKQVEDDFQSKKKDRCDQKMKQEQPKPWVQTRFLAQENSVKLGKYRYTPSGNHSARFRPNLTR